MSGKKPLYSGRKSSRGSISALKKWSISKRLPPVNRISTKKLSDIEEIGTSARKLTYIDSDEFQIEDGFSYRIVNFLAMFTALSQLLV